MKTTTKPTAIIADDVFAIRILLRRTLETVGCEIIAMVDNGAEAIAKIVSLKPDLVFIDIDMPGMSGLDVLDRLKAKNIDVFKVIVSGHNTIDNVKQAIAGGANGFIVKPYSVSKMNQIMEKYNASLK